MRRVLEDFGGGGDAIVVEEVERPRKHSYCPGCVRHEDLSFVLCQIKNRLDRIGRRILSVLN